jgi:two-component system CheB/CheR fusion protein
VLFARHSLLKDPPFSRTDLISCRNLMIYLDRDRQQQVCGAFHFALNPSGYLFLGSSESADSPPGLFRALDREARIYQRMPVDADVRLTARVGPSHFGVEAALARTQPPFRAAGEPGAHREALERLAPPSVIVDESYRVVHLSETVGRYIQLSAGPLANDITELAREELRFDLRALLHRAFARKEAALSGPIAVRLEGAPRRVYLQVRPHNAEGSTDRSAIVFFFEGEAFDGATDGGQRAPSEEVRQLQQELHVAQSQLRVSHDEYENANEELRAANEELQSINEEYRSTAGGARNQQGRAAVDQRGTADRQRRAEDRTRKRVARPQRRPEPDGGDGRRNPVPRLATANQALYAADHRPLQRRTRR